MSALSESTIKQLGLGFLKSYYRLRPRGMDTVVLTGMDIRGVDDVVADAYLRYTEADGTVFSATLEATSYQTRNEIVYRPRRSHVFWDGLAFGALLLPALMSMAHIYGWYPLVGEDFWVRVGLLLMTLPLLMGVYALLFQRLPRYRYIYAVEQFKQYYADDQWIAYSYDVFVDLKPKYHRELVRQCTRFGFGLVEITSQRKPKLLIAPSRAQNFVPEKPFLPWLTQAEWQTKMRALAKRPWVRFKAFLVEILPANRQLNFRWFSRTYYHQWTLFTMGLIAIGYFATLEYKRVPTHFVQEKWYHRRLTEARDGMRPETKLYLVDAPVPGFYDTTYQPFNIRSHEELFGQLVQAEGSTHADSIADTPVRILTATAGEALAAYYSCNRYNALTQAFYLLADTMYVQQSVVKQRLSELNDRGINATAVWPPCIGGTGKGFLVYIDDILFDDKAAYALRDSLQQQLDTLDRQLTVMRFLPITNQPD